MPAKRGLVRALLDINLSSGLAGDPVSLSPDIWYGIDDKLTVGLVHSFVGETGIVGIPGTSLCFGDSCTDVYNGLGLDARYTLAAQDKLAVAFDGGLIVNEIDPFELALKVGAVGRYRAATKLAIDFSPNVFVGLTQRDGAVMTSGNKEVLTVPVTGVYDASDNIGVMAQLALLLPINVAGDFYAIAASLGGTYAVNRQLSLEVAFTLPALAGGKALQTGVDARTFTLGGAYAF